MSGTKSLQFRFSHTRAWRHVMQEYYRSIGVPGHSALVYEIMQEIVGTYTDNQIRDLCVMILQSADINKSDRYELLHLLCLV